MGGWVESHLWTISVLLVVQLYFHHPLGLSLSPGPRGLNVHDTFSTTYTTMDSNTSSGSGPVKKQEDLDANEPKVAPKAESKPAVRTLNRVPRKL